jgi:hypothetical protein
VPVTSQPRWHDPAQVAQRARASSHAEAHATEGPHATSRTGASTAARTSGAPRGAELGFAATHAVLGALDAESQVAHARSARADAPNNPLPRGAPAHEMRYG